MTQFTASEMRAEAHRHANEVEDMLNAFADLLEAQEKAVPFGYFGWREQKHMDAEGHCTVSRKAFADLEVTTPVYTHPATSDAERLEPPSNLQEALCVIENAALHGVTLHGDDIPRLRATVDRIAPAQQSQDAERLAEALRKIVEWNPPMTTDHEGKPASMSLMYGSNGVRDYFRNVAREALATHSAKAQLNPAKVADHIVDAIVDGLEVADAQAQPPAGQFDPGRDEAIRIHPDVAKAQAIPFDVNDGRPTRSAQAQPPVQSEYAPTYPDQAKDPFWTVPGMVDTRPKTHGTQARPAVRVTDAMVEDGCVAWNKSAGLGYAVADRDCMRAAIEAALAAQENPNGF